MIATDIYEPNCDSSSNRNSVVDVEDNDPDAAPPTNQPVNNMDTPTTTATSSDTPNIDNTVNITINNENEINILSQQNNNANPNKSNDTGKPCTLLKSAYFHASSKSIM